MWSTATTDEVALAKLARAISFLSRTEEVCLCVSDAEACVGETKPGQKRLNKHKKFVRVGFTMRFCHLSFFRAIHLFFFV